MKDIAAISLLFILAAPAQAADLSMPRERHSPSLPRERETTLRQVRVQEWPAPIVRFMPRAGRATEITYVTLPVTVRTVEEVVTRQPVIKARY